MMTGTLNQLFSSHRSWKAKSRTGKVSFCVFTSFQAIDWINRSLYPSNFARNFPNGIESYDRSAFMQIYKLGQALFQLEIDNLIPIVIGLEIALISIALHFLAKTIFPNASPLISLVVILLAVSSFSRDMNFANFGHPFFKGLFYNAADFFRILAIIMIIRQRAVYSFLFIACAFLIHPTLGLMGAVFILAAWISLPPNFGILRPSGVFYCFWQ